MIGLDRNEELQIKLERVRDLLKQHELSGLLLKKQPNFSWLTAGGLNMVGFATEMGMTSILVTETDLYVIANRIEAERMMDEEGLKELGFKLLTHEWFEDKEANLVKEVVGDAPVGCDVQLDGFKYVEPDIKELRYSLTEAEIERYLFLGARASYAMEKVLYEVKPGDSEAEIVGRLSEELWKNRIDPTGFIIAADERIRLYRHPIPTMKRVEKCLMLSVNARYRGLIASITRFLYFGPLSHEFARQYRDNVEIECLMIAKTEVGKEMNIPFMAGLKRYEELGYPDEWKLHHQGGATGYSARDIKVNESTTQRVQENQAFCWNPSITGTKSEDVFIATRSGPLMVSKPVIFPVMQMEVEGIEFTRPSILVR
ncbi:MAG: M24 family metallopeptidase [Bacillota bacterium]